MLCPEENNYLAALFSTPGRDQWGLAWADLSTGEFVSTTASTDRLGSALVRCSPTEILLPEFLNDQESVELEDIRTILDQILPPTCMRTYRSIESFTDHIRFIERGQLPPPPPSLVKSQPTTAANLAERAAAAAILDYVDFTQRSSGESSVPLFRMRSPLHVESSDHMIIDTSAWKALEITKSMTTGTKQSSLLQCIDATMTSSGTRLLTVSYISFS